MQIPAGYLGSRLGKPFKRIVLGLTSHIKHGAVATLQPSLLLGIAGLYGRVVPTTVSNFVKLAKGGAYTGTIFSKVQPCTSDVPI